MIVRISWLAGLIIALQHACVLAAQHQTTQLDDPLPPASKPYSLELRVADFAAHSPTLHSYIAGKYAGEWLLLGGKTNGLHGMTGRNAFDPAFENREAWVINPITGHAWRKSLLTSLASGLSTDVVDSLSSVNAQFLQVESFLYVVGGYGFSRTLNNHTTYATLTAIDVPEMIAWVKAPAGSETNTAASAVRQLVDPFFKVTGGGLVRIGDEFQLIFGQDYEGAYRPTLNGVYTQQVRRFRVASAFPELSVVPGSQLVTTPHPDYRRRDLNVLPIIEKRAIAPFDLVERAMVLGGVFTLAGGVWTLPVIISEGGDMQQQVAGEAGTLHQALQQYHCAKTLLFDTTSGEMHCVLYGGISLKYWDEATQQYLTDGNAPFVNDVTTVVRHADGAIRQYRLPHLFPDLRAPWDASKPLLFGTNAEFFPAPDTPMLTSYIVDLAAIRERRLIGWIHGGIMAEAPNFGATGASGYIFEVWLTPHLSTPAAPAIEATQNAYRLSWQGDAQRADLLEASDDLLDWAQLDPPFAHDGPFTRVFAPPTTARFYRIRSSTMTTSAP